MIGTDDLSFQPANSVQPVVFASHALQQLQDRGASQAEVIETIRFGRREPARRGRTGFRRSFDYNALWNGRHHNAKQVLAIVVERPNQVIVVTVYASYF